MSKHKCFSCAECDDNIFESESRKIFIGNLGYKVCMTCYKELSTKAKTVKVVAK